jgi:hypothetical protein
MTMKRLLVVAAASAACLTFSLQGPAAAPADVVCSQDTFVFSGTARDLIIPEGGGCDVLGATVMRNLIVRPEAGVGVFETTIGRDLIVGRASEAFVAATEIGHDLTAQTAAGLHLERTTIGHDLVANEPQTVQTSRIAPDTPGGPVRVGHDFVIDGSPELPFVFDGICAATVVHDFRITDRAVTLGFGIGEQCAGNGFPANSVGHDLIVTGNTALAGFFGPSSLRVGGNRVGHDLVFSDNNAVPGGSLEVSDNIVGHDAICTANNPALTMGPDDGPNVTGHSNSCG